jgi:hypothetical protein
MKAPAAMAVVVALALSACADMSNPQQRALSGGAMGAAGGAAIGAMVGGAAVPGALIGAGGGALIGALLPDNWLGHKTAAKDSR